MSEYDDELTPVAEMGSTLRATNIRLEAEITQLKKDVVELEREVKAALALAHQ